MIWYEERLVRALQQARLADARPRASHRRRVALTTRPVGGAWRPATVR